MLPLIQADARRLPLPDGSVSCVVTSPPYFGLRRYGDDILEIGTDSLKGYIADIILAGLEIYRVLGDEDIFWLNIGDTASGSGGAGGDWKNGARAGARKWKQGETGMAPMQWLNIPARVSIALQDMGWLLRHTLVWEKPRMRPEDLKHTRRPGVSHETVLMFAKTRKHRFYPEGLVEKGSVWHMSTAVKPHHTAAFPLELARRCISCSTEPGDVVLDPFAGSGTTLQAAEDLGRVGVGTDLYA